ncbi:MAG: tetratricopeptide repeat protein [Bryobacteraceae bacterium]|nr:tetratricopeptide repeat protein [Bryobacteraceae bacterium]
MMLTAAAALLLLQAGSPLDRAKELVREGKIDEAERVLAVTDSGSADVHKLRGLIAFHKRDYRTAARELSEAIREEPLDSGAYRDSAGMLGKSLYLVRDFAAAAAWLEKAYRAGDRSAEALQLLGVSAIHAARPELARQAFATLYGTPADSAAAHVLTAQMMIREDSEGAAETELRKALAIDPRFPTARFLAAELAIARGEIGKAIEELTAEISYNPMHASSYWRLGDAYLRQGKYDEAIAELRKSIWLNPYFSSPYILLGRAYFQKAEYKDAEEVLRYAIGIDPNNYGAHYMLGRALVKLGRDAEAQEVFLKSRDLPRDRATSP